MKSSQLLAVTLLTLMLLAAAPSRVVQAQGSYSEKLTVYVAGSDALWFFTYSGLNSSSVLTAFESTPGLSSYNLTAIKTTAWSSDFQIFGTKGYNLLPVPFIPSEGLFLTVGSDSFADARGSATALETFMFTSFRSISNGTGTFSFYAPISFTSLVPTTMFELIPTTEHGFASAVGPSWASTASPFMSVNGQKGSSGFNRNMVVGSITPTALDAAGKPSILSYFGGTPLTELQSSIHSSSSVIRMSFLDGIVASKDAGAVVSKDSAHFTGSYELTLASGKHVSKINATVVEQPAELQAYRSVSAAVLRTGNDFAVTLNLKDLSPSSAITKISFSDNWWNTTGNFRFLSGNYTVKSTSLSPGTSITPVYRLEYTGTTSGTVIIPPSVVRYSYLVGGVIFNATTSLNPIRLSLGADGPVVVATMVPDGVLGKSVGDVQKFNVTVTNVGTQPASSVVVAGTSIPGLAGQSGGSPGGTATITVTQSASGFVGINQTRSYAVSYQDPAGSSFNATTNVLSDIFSHTTMKLGLPSLVLGVQLSFLKGTTNLTLSLTITNSGHANVTNFAASESLPSGLGCGKIVGKAAATKGVSCTSGVLSLDYPVVTATTFTAYMEYNLTSPQSFLLGPIPFTGASSGSNITGKSNAVPIPTGITIIKQFNPSQLFPGMTSQVSVSASNGGPFQFYNLSLGTTADSFDSVSGTSNLSKKATIWQAGVTKSFSYSVALSQVSGLQTGAVPSASFFFGGTPFSLSGVGPAVNVYAPLAITISTNPAAPEEGKNFTINFQVSNPSGVSVSDVHFTLPLPSGLGLSSLRGATVTSGVLDIFASSLASGASVNASARVIASSGIVIPYDKAKLTFSYSGITINGIVPKNGIAIAEDVTTRYIIPTGLVILIVLFVAFYVRRKAGPNALSSRK